MTRYWKLAVLASLLGSACRVGPSYQRPTTPVPVALKELTGNDQWKMATPSDELLPTDGVDATAVAPTTVESPAVESPAVEPTATVSSGGAG